jgi:hypothetical protein
MALPKRKIPMDLPGTIAARERLRPVDATIVLAKLADGTVVEVHNAGVLKKQPDGSMKPWAIWQQPLADDIREQLAPGIAEQFEFKWVNKHPLSMASAQGAPQWQIVKKKEHICFCPAAPGDRTDANIHWVDQILHFRPRSLGEQFSREKQMMNDPNAIAQAAIDSHGDEFASMGARDVTATLTALENDAVERKASVAVED